MSAQRIEQAWQTRAACRGPHAVVFYPPSTFERKEERRLREARAKDICRTCPVRAACLDYALTIREPHGIWGGLNEAERRALLTEREETVVSARRH